MVMRAKCWNVDCRNSSVEVVMDSSPYDGVVNREPPEDNTDILVVGYLRVQMPHLFDQFLNTYE